MDISYGSSIGRIEIREFTDILKLNFKIQNLVSSADASTKFERVESALRLMNGKRKSQNGF